MEQAVVVWSDGTCTSVTTLADQQQQQSSYAGEGGDASSLTSKLAGMINRQSLDTSGRRQMDVANTIPFFPSINRTAPAVHLSPSAGLVLFEGPTTITSHLRSGSSDSKFRVTSANVPVKQRDNVHWLLAIRNHVCSNVAFPEDDEVSFGLSLGNIPVLQGGSSNESGLYHSQEIALRKTRTLIEFARWPLPIEYERFRERQQLDLLLTHHPSTKTRTIQSLDKSVHLTESYHCHSITVRYPALARASTPVKLDRLEAATAKPPPHLTYVWVEQSFSPRNLPQCWRYPLALMQGLASQQELEQLVADTPRAILSSSHVSIPLPPSISPEALRSDRTNPSFDPSVSRLWTYAPQGCADITISQLITTLAHFRVQWDEVLEQVFVQATIHKDGAVLEASDEFSFLTLYIPEEGQDAEGQMYSVKNVPLVGRNLVSGVEYPLQALCSDMLKLYHMATQYITFKKQSTTHTSPPKQQNSTSYRISNLIKPRAIMDTTEMRGYPCRASRFSDGSVDFEFTDNVTVHVQDTQALMNSVQAVMAEEDDDGAFERILVTVTEEGVDGVTTLRVANPVGYERHVHMVLQIMSLQKPPRPDRVVEATQALRRATDALQASRKFLGSI